MSTLRIVDYIPTVHVQKIVGRDRTGRERRMKTIRHGDPHVKGGITIKVLERKSKSKTYKADGRRKNMARKEYEARSRE